MKIQCVNMSKNDRYFKQTKLYAETAVLLSHIAVKNKSVDIKGKEEGLLAQYTKI